jgi:hypothetical protein
LDISDAYAKQIVIKDGRSDVAAHMLHRVKNPLPSQYRSILKDPQGGCAVPGSLGSDQESFTISYASSC